MAQIDTKNGIKKATLKVVMPVDLKGALQLLADERSITLSSLLRLISSEYVKRQQAS